MSKTNTERLNRLKVGDCLHKAGIDYLKFQSLERIIDKRDYSYLFADCPWPEEFKVIYTSVDYVLINWSGCHMYFLSNSQ